MNIFTSLATRGKVNIVIVFFHELATESQVPKEVSKRIALPWHRSPHGPSGPCCGLVWPTAGRTGALGGAPLPRSDSRGPSKTCTGYRELTTRKGM